MALLSHPVCYPGTRGALCCFPSQQALLLVKSPDDQTSDAQITSPKRRRESFTTRGLGFVGSNGRVGLGWVEGGGESVTSACLVALVNFYINT